MTAPLLRGWGGIRLVETTTYTNIENDSPRSSPTSQVFIGEVASNAELTFLELKRRGYNTVRACWRPLVPETDWNPYTDAYMERFIEIAKALDMWIIVDCHGYNQHYQNEDEWINQWQSIVSKFKDTYDKIVWEPINEPVMDPLTGQTAVTELARIYQRWIDMCRGLGDTHWIVVSRACWSLDIPYVEWFPSVADPLNRVFLGAHAYYQYEWSQDKWTVTDAQKAADEQFNNLKTVVARYGRPYLCTEMSADPYSSSYGYEQVPGAKYGGAAGYSDVSLAFMQRTISNFVSAGWGYILWVAGDWGKDWSLGWHYGGLYGGLDVWGQHVPQPPPPSPSITVLLIPASILAFLGLVWAATRKRRRR
jgi:aryl-phospho-beta-D-glucosidase BglC (GH1 family)